MQQAAFFDGDESAFLDHIVNVASVPQRSPFRYPGGKTWLVPRVRRWLASRTTKPQLFIEPFVGGGIISLTVAFERLADKVIMVELDDQVAAVWKTLLNGGGKQLAERIANFDLKLESVKMALAQVDGTQEDKAFRTILKNRVNRGGILAPGAGLIKQGENGKGLASRWYPDTLRRRILDIATISERIEFIEGDGMAVLRKNVRDCNAMFFIDPPYTAAGKKAGSRLYTHSELRHEELFRLGTLLAGDFLMTYDNTDEVRELAGWYGLDTLQVAMKNTHHAKMTELLIGRDLNWARV